MVKVHLLVEYMYSVNMFNFVETDFRGIMNTCIFVVL